MQITLQLKVKRSSPRARRRPNLHVPHKLSALARAFRKGKNSASTKRPKARADRQERLFSRAIDKLTELVQQLSRVQELVQRMDIIERVHEQLRDELDQHLDEDLFSDDDLFTDDDRAAAPKSPLADSIAICVPGPEGEEC